ncbi:type I-C CRISPR-associated protein Cas7/Csd2 [Ruminococcus sp.]|uniref:type I-C CRISPR-associated protein Cas7/Csd2 n=1 Tax=Ruminococcus sp. TaxID=41978 RepID=UPI0025E1E5AC|nr:type I-C CRISPR-associated protein Cas7/Csd2 [Ruminococcus sp.]
MAALEHKIDFALIVTAKNANPNGDPLSGNRPRETYDGYGEISDVCIKRKIRNRFQDMGENIFVQSADRATDGFTSLQGRAEGCAALKAIVNGKKTDSVKYAEAACQEWIDVRTFGQVFAFSNISVGVRGPVSIQPAISASPVDIVSMQITKSVNGEDKKERSSDTMGMKHSVDFGMYVIYGSVNCQLAEKTGFSAEDAALLKEALKTLFENDCSSARPEGSMEVCRLYWWEHDCKTPKYSSAKVHRQLKVNLKADVQRPASFWDYEISLDVLDGLNAEVIDLI